VPIGAPHSKSSDPFAIFDGVTYARLEDQNGRTFAEIGTGVVLETDIEASNIKDALSVLAGRPIIVAVPVRHGGESIGALVLLSQTNAVWSRIAGFLGDLAIGSILAAIIGIGGVSLMTRRITAPIKNLSTAMAKVREEQDFSAQLERISHDETGQLTDAFNEMISDIRDRDERLQRHREDLEDTVDQRTRQLRVAKDEAEQANAAKSDFLATMSHEIRTPMNGMLVMAELLTQSKLPGRLSRYAEVINKSGQNLLTIINDILDFSKIEAGRMSLEDGRWDPRELAVDVLDVFHDRACAKGVELVCHVEPDVPETLGGDPVRLRQVLSNLVNNAIKFTDQGAVAVKVMLTGANDHLRIVVRDTGIGIPQDKCANIFEAFLQADQSTTRQYGGTGLGLAIAKRLVGAMDGQISVSSVVGEGSDFIIELPLSNPTSAPNWPGFEALGLLNASIDVDGPAMEDCLRRHLQDLLPEQWVAAVEAKDGHSELRITSVERIGNRTPKANERVIIVGDAGDQRAESLVANRNCHAVLMLPFGHRRLATAIRVAYGLDHADGVGDTASAEMIPQWPDQRVLVADDSEVNLEVAREALTRFGISPTCVLDGAAALEALETELYDLVLMDCSMPVMDGYEATRQIRASQIQSRTQPDLPVIALTANASIASESHWKDAGMNGYLAKPFTLEDLETCLSEWLREPITTSSVHRDVSDAAVEAIISGQDDARVARSTRDQEEGSGLICEDGLQAIAELTGGLSIDLFKRLVSLYEDNAPEVAERIVEATNTQDLDQLAKAAHALKSMSNNIAARKVAETCQAMESLAKAGDMTALREASEIAELVARTISTLHDRVEVQSGGDFAGTCGKVEPSRKHA
jgi:signal transduction histidine kinase/CheY-like chemotaxis protein